MQKIHIKVAKHFVAGTWFVIWAYLALEVLSMVDYYMAIPAELDADGKFRRVIIFRYIPLFFSFLVGAKFGTQLLSNTNITKREIIIIGCKIPIYSVLLTVITIALTFTSTIFFEDLSGIPYASGYYISFLTEFLLSGISIALTSSPIITPFGILAALILRYIFSQITNLDKRKVLISNEE